MVTLFFDVETDGLPRTAGRDPRMVEQYPRIIQIAWLVADIREDWSHAPLISRSTLIKPDGWVVPDGDFWREHGFYTEVSEQHGLPIAQVLGTLLEDLEGVDLVVCHNTAFDINVLMAELYRLGVHLPDGLRKYCTMEGSKEWSKQRFLSGVTYEGRWKLPSLSELYYQLFGCEFRAHDAMEDVKALFSVFIEGMKRKIFI
jgi:DNA polymerase III epsilon subunit-like protein